MSRARCSLVDDERLVLLFVLFQIGQGLLQRSIPFFFVLVGQQVAEFGAADRRSVVLDRAQNHHGRHLAGDDLDGGVVDLGQLPQSEHAEPDHENLKTSEGYGQLPADVQIAKPTHVTAFPVKKSLRSDRTQPLDAQERSELRTALNQRIHRQGRTARIRRDAGWSRSRMGDVPLISLGQLG